MVLPLHVPRYDAIRTITVEAVVIILYETISFMHKFFFVLIDITQLQKCVIS